MDDATPNKHHGLVTARGKLDLSREVAIYLNGEDVTARCQAADDGFGFVILWTEPRDGELRRRELIFGDVHIFGCEV